jgi:hypothetical protein
VELQPPGEVLGEVEDWNEPLADRLGQALRRHPTALAVIIIVVLVLADRRPRCASSRGRNWRR